MKTLRDNNLVPFFENGAKVKIPFDIGSKVMRFNMKLETLKVAITNTYM